MAPADEDNFDIDIYGDGDGDGDMGNDGTMEYKQEDDDLQFNVDDDEEDVPPTAETQNKAAHEDAHEDAQALPPSAAITPQPQVKAEADQQPQTIPVPTKPVAPQGVKRKETSDERPIDHGATNALMISDLHWWTTEDDIRGWTNEVGAEEELKELTFSEHKVNGKSKGWVHQALSESRTNTTAQAGISRVHVPSSNNSGQA